MPKRTALAHHERPGSVWTGLRTLVVRTAKDTLEDRAPGLAAEVAFYTILAIPPLVLALFGVAGFVSNLIGPVHTSQVRDWVLKAADNFLSADTVRTTIRPTVNAVLTNGRADVAVLGVGLALWSGSRATAVAVEAVTLAYDLQPRAGWKRRLLAVAMTLAAVVAGLVTIPLLVVGPRFPDLIGLPAIFQNVWSIAYWPVMVVAVGALLTTFYDVAAPWSTPWYRDIPGALLAMGLWLGGSAALRVYAAWSIQSNSTYGSLAAPIVVLLWLYLTAFAVLMGAEINAEIEHLWPRRARLHELHAAQEAPTDKDPSDIDKGQEAVQA